MISTIFNKTTKRCVIAFTMAFALVLMAGTDVSAQGKHKGHDRGRNNDPYNNGYPNNNGYPSDDVYNSGQVNGRDRNGNQSVRFAFKRGYQEGRRQARQDLRNNNGGNYGNNGGYYGNNGGSIPNNGGYYGNNGGYSGNNSGYYGNGNRNGWGNSQIFQNAYENGYKRGYNEVLNGNRNRSGRNRAGSRLPY